MSEELLRDRLRAARLALADEDIAVLVAAMPALEAAVSTVRRAAQDLPPAGWNSAETWTTTRS